MNPVIAALPKAPSLPVAGSQAKVPRDIVSGLESVTNSEANGADFFSAMLLALSPGLVSQSKSAVAGSVDTAPGQTLAALLPNKPTTRRADGKSKTSNDAETTAIGAIATIMPRTPAPVSPNESQSTPAISATETMPTSARTLPPVATGQPTLPAIATSQPTSPPGATSQPELSPVAAGQSSLPVATSPPTVPVAASQPTLPPSATSQAGDSIPRQLQSNVETPVGQPFTRLDSKSSMLQGPTQTLLAATDTVPIVENTVARNDREQLPTKDANAQPPAVANLVPAPRTEPTARLAAANSALSLPEQIHDQLSGHLEQLQQTGRVEAQMSLHPPELGPVQLHLTLEDGRLNVRMLVQDDNAKRLIDQQVEPLRVRFAEMGVSVGQFDVRRDGGSANPEQHQSAETSAQTLQPSGPSASGAQKPYGKVANSAALVDLIA